MVRELAGCPKCGVEMLLTRADPTLDAALRRHVIVEHPAAIGTAKAPDRDPLHFAYVRPVPGMSEPWWYVLTLEGPAMVTKLRVSAWSITWAMTPREAVTL